MERVLSRDERIRRAEEIYARRQNLREKTKRATLNVSEGPRNFRLLKRLVLQIVICMLIYFIFYLVNTTNYSFSADALATTDELISHDVDFMKIINSVITTIGGYISSLNETNQGLVNQNVIDMGDENIEGNNIEEESEIDEEEGKNEDAQENDETGKQEESKDEDERTGQEKISNVNMSEADRIKKKYSFIVPTNRIYYFRIWDKGIHF